MLYNIGLEAPHRETIRNNSAIEEVVPLIDDFAASSGKATGAQYTTQTLLLRVRCTRS